MAVKRLGSAVVAAGLAFAAPAEAQSFNRADRDVDGHVSFAEARSVMPQLLEPWFGKCDADEDGRLDRAEFNCVRGIYEVMKRGN
jgi:EF hand